MVAIPNDWSSASEWADAYRAYGLAVVPAAVSADGKKKHPTAGWKEFQQNGVPQTIHDRWYGRGGSECSRDTMGFITGRACFDNGRALLCIDVDVKEGKGGLATWRGWLAVHNNDMDLETWTATTGSGGLHYYFRFPAHLPVYNTQETIDGIDVRGHGGFIMAPPSRHYLPGKYYSWKDGYAPWDIEIADAPEWLLEVVMSISEVSLARSDRITQTATPDRCTDAFGNDIDGRDKKMADVAYAAMLDAYRLIPIRPDPKALEEIIERAYGAYAAHTESRVERDGRTKDERLEAEGRGRQAMREKILRHFRVWDTHLAAAARKPPRSVVEKKLADAARGDPEARDILEQLVKWWREDGDDATADWVAQDLKRTSAKQPEPEQPQQAKATSSVIPTRTAFPINPTDIPKRAWIVRGVLIRKHITLLVAPGGSGKSLLTMQLACALGAGRTWGGWTIDKQYRSLVVNAEDDSDELNRRLVAAAHEMRIAQTDIGDRVVIAEDPQDIVVAKVDVKTKTVTRTDLVERLVKTITDQAIDVVIVDPFAETFEGDENSNSDVKWVAAIWREVARRTDSSVLLVHHTKKYATGMSGDADAARGAGALVNSARIAATLFTMSSDEAKTFDIDADDRTKYVRFDDAKANMTLMTGKAKWFEKKSVNIGNGKDLELSDDVGVLVPWKPPGMFDNVTDATINLTLDQIDRGAVDDEGRPTGALFTRHDNSTNKNRWAGAVIKSMFGCDDGNAKRVVKAWIDSGLLVEVEYKDGKQDRKGLRVDDSKRPGGVE